MAKKADVYGCKVEPGKTRKGCGSGSKVVDIKDLAKRVAALEAEKKRKREAGKQLERRPVSGHKPKGK